MNELAALRGSSPFVYCTSESNPKPLTGADVAVFSRMLRRHKTAKLDLLLHCEGGQVSAARSLAVECYESSASWNVMVFRRALSAGTLLCLGAHSITVGPFAEFSPIDPFLRVCDNESRDNQARVSSEDLRAFRAMAASWFDLHSEESRIRVLEILSERISPIRLGAFFRAEQYVRRIANELLEHQLPTVSQEIRAGIAEKLISGFANHRHPIGVREFAALGVKMENATEHEIALMRAIFRSCQNLMHNDGQREKKESAIRALFFCPSSALAFYPSADVASDDEGEHGESEEYTRRGEWRNIGAFRE